MTVILILLEIVYVSFLKLNIEVQFTQSKVWISPCGVSLLISTAQIIRQLLSSYYGLNIHHNDNLGAILLCWMYYCKREDCSIWDLDFSLWWCWDLYSIIEIAKTQPYHSSNLSFIFKVWLKKCLKQMWNLFLLVIQIRL